MPRCLALSLVVFLAPLASAQDTPPPAAVSFPLQPDLKSDASFWSTSPQDFAQKNPSFRTESKTASSLVLRSHQILSFLGKPTLETLVYFENNLPIKVAASFYNKGDVGLIDPKDQKKLESEIQQSMDALIGTPGVKFNDKVANGVHLQGLRWKNDFAVFDLAFAEGEFVNLEITPVPKNESDNLVDQAIAESKKTGSLHTVDAQAVVANVIKESNGDVWIQNIPMVDQGEKGYCTVATMERVFRYYGIDVDEHLIAQEAQTRAGGGTSIYEACEAARHLVRGTNLQVVEFVGSHLDVHKVHSYIDQGIPIVWTVNLALDPEHEVSVLGQYGGHTRMIIGYNDQKHTLLYSDSWGIGHAKKEMTEARAKKMHVEAFVARP